MQCKQLRFCSAGRDPSATDSHVVVMVQGMLVNQHTACTLVDSIINFLGSRQVKFLHLVVRMLFCVFFCCCNQVGVGEY